MDGGHLAAGARATFLPDDLTALIEALWARGYRVLAPQTRDGAIVYDTVCGVAHLPRGWTDQQEPGRYRLARRDDEALFGYAVGPHSWKRFLHPPIETMWRGRPRPQGDGV